MVTGTPEEGLMVQEPQNGSIAAENVELTPQNQEKPTNGQVREKVEPQEVLDDQELKGILEALLYVSHEPLTLEKLMTVFGGTPKIVLHNALQALQQDYDQEGRGLKISEVAGGFVMVTRQDCAPWITRLQKVKPSARVSRSAMETLAIVAYKQPIVRAEIEQIRGVETSGVLRTLLDQKLLRIVGRKDVPGRPIMYGTSKTFLQRFGLRDLRDLPPLREFQALGEQIAQGLFDNSSVEDEENQLVVSKLMDSSSDMEDESLS